MKLIARTLIPLLSVGLVAAAVQDENWLREARDWADAQEYEITYAVGGASDDPQGTWQAPNRAQGFRVHFAPQEIRVFPREDSQAAWEFGLGFVGHGGRATARPRFAADLVTVGPRIEYRRGNLYEWFVNGREGLKHGFTFYAAPEARGSDTLVRIDLAVTGSLLPVPSADGQAVDFVSGDSPLAVLHYGGLVVQDADERTLPSWMEVVRESGSVLIRLIFDDAEAVYPITVDPLLTGPAWQAEGNQTGARFGAAVAGAGDVNCDGYDDVLVAAPYFDGGSTDEGRVFVFHGSPSGLGATPAWWAESNQADANLGGIQLRFGGPVAGAGNIDRDGVCRGGANPGSACDPDAATSTCTEGGVCRGCDDIVIGAPRWKEGSNIDAGLAVVYFGSATGLNKNGTRPVGDPGNADLRLAGAAANARLGFSVAGTGDTNGDGFGGIVVGEPGYNSYKGRVLVRLYVGGTPWNACEYRWPTNNEFFGESVAGGGDFDGDGFADVAAAAPAAYTSRGSLLVYFGKPGVGVCSTPTDPAPHTCPTNTPADSRKCWLEIVAPDNTPAAPGSDPQTLAFLGNVNGDRFDDLAIGGKGYGTSKGAVWVYYGKENPFTGTSNTNRFDWRRVGPTQAGSDPFFGASVSAAGDVNGDGFDDLLVGSPNSDSCDTSACYDTGSAYLWLGSATGLPLPSGKANDEDAAPYPDWKVAGSQAYERLGISVAGAGDVNGDGFDDLVIGARDYNGDKEDEGRSVVYHGTAAGRINALTLALHLLETDLPSGSGSMIGSAGAVFNATRCSGGLRVGQFCTGTPPLDCPGVGGSCTFNADSAPNFGSIPQNETTAWSPAVGYGPVPHSVILSTGLALDMGRGNTDLVPAGPDHAQWLFLVKVPGVCEGGTASGQACTGNSMCPGGACQNNAKTLRFTTQFVTSELDRAQPKQDTVSFWFSRSGTEVPTSVNLDGIAALGSRRENPPIAHGLSLDRLDAGDEMKLGFLIADKDDGLYDSALIVSRMFFSDIPIPAETQFLSNPAPQDVGLATGTFTYDKKLYEVPGIGLPFEFSVRYNSASSESGVLGPKWVHSYQASAQKTTVRELIGSCSASTEWACDTAADCDAGASCSNLTAKDVDLLIVRPGTGGAEYFRCRNQGGTCGSGQGGKYKPKYPGTYSTIAEDEVDQKFTYTTKEKVQYVFEQDSGLPKLRLLKSVKDANNNTITLNYTTSDKKIDYVLDTRGEAFTFNYSGGKLASVEGSGGRVTLAYHAQTGYMKSLIDLNGYPTTFTYDERGNLLTLTDADGVAFNTNEYEAYQGSGRDQIGDRVVKRRNAKPGDEGIAVEFSGDTLTRTDRVGGKEIERQDVKDRLVEKKVLLCTGATCPGSNPGSPDFWGLTKTAYDAADNPISQVDPRGTTTSMSYDGLGNLTSRGDAFDVCVGGINVGKPCTADSQCPTSTCRRRCVGGINQGNICTADNQCLDSTCGLRVEMNYFLGCAGGANDGTSCTTDSTCTGGGKCVLTPWVTHRGVHPAIPGSCQGSSPLGTCYQYTYDAKGNLLSERDELNQSVTYGYPSSNNKGLPDRMTDRRESVWEYTYNTLGHRTSVTDPDPDDTGPLGRPVTRYGYDVMGRVISIWDPLNNRKSFAYDAGGRKTAEWNPLGNRTTYQYDAWGRPTLTTDPAGATKAYTYTITGRLKDTTEPLGIVQRYAYDLEDRLTSETDPSGRSTTYTCDEGDRLVRVHDPMNGAVQAAYDPAGNLVAVTDPRENTTRFAYDLLNRQTLESDPVQADEPTPTGVKTDYTPRGDIAKSTNGRGQQVAYTYDAAGRLTGMALPSRTITHGLDANGNQTGTTDPLFPQIPPGPAIQRKFDPLDRLTSRTDPFGRTVGYTYDLAGNVVQITYPSGSVVNYSYDAANRLVGVDYPGLFTDGWQADFAVNATRLQPDGRILIGGGFTTVRGASRRGIARLNADGSLDTTFQNGMVGVNGVVNSVALQPDGHVLIGGQFWTVNGESRDGIARLNTDGSLDATFQNGMVGADSAVNSVALQPDGRVLIGGWFGTVNGESRNGIARLNTDGSLDATFQNGMVGASSEVNSVALQPDGRVLIGGQFWAVNGVSPNGIARLNADGSLDATFQNWMVEVDNEVKSVALQPDGRVLIGGLFETVNGESRDGIARLNADGSLDMTFQNGMVGVYGGVNSVALQPDGRVLIGGQFWTVNGVSRNGIARLNADGSLDTTFQNGMAGANREVNSVALQPDGRVLIGGDFSTVNGVSRKRIARLSSIGRPDGGATVYAYNAAGKVTQAAIPDGSSVAYTYDAAHRLVGIADGAVYQATLTRDLAGRITKVLDSGALAPNVATETTGFTHDAANRLSGPGVTNDLDGNLTDATLGGSATTLQYDALNRLVGITRDGVATTYRYDADGLRVDAVRDGLSTTYVYDVRTGNLLEEYAGKSLTPTARYVWGHGLIGRETSDGWHFYHFDHRGNTVALTTDDGAVTDRYAYDPYGRPAGQVGTATNPFKFVGRHGVFDEGNGLLFMRNRHYAPELMRFVQKDQAVAGELKDPQSLNRYAYVQGDPIQYIDPDGDFLFIGYDWENANLGSFLWETVSVGATVIGFLSIGATAGSALAVAGVISQMVGFVQGVVEPTLAIVDKDIQSVVNRIERDMREAVREAARHDTLAQDSEKERTRPKSPVQSLSPDAPAPCR